VESALVPAKAASERRLRGGRFGRPPKLTLYPRQEALQRLAAGETQADIARTYNVDATTIGRLEPSPFGQSSVAGLA